MEKRSGLIIGCHGGSRNEYLHGVLSDMESVVDFLSSPRSGCFYRDEYQVIDNPSFAELQKIIHSAVVEYQVIYFAGHGYTDRRTNKRMICLRDKDVPDTFLFNESKIQLIIIDACRTLMPGIAGIFQYVEPYISFDGIPQSRSVFDNYISKANAGKLILHGTQKGNQAWEHNSGRGGVFTQSLLRTASTIPITGIHSPVYICDLLPLVKTDMKQSGFHIQAPEIVSQTSGYNMPFIINSPQILKKVNHDKIGTHRGPYNVDSPLAACLGITLLAFGITWLLD